MGVYTDSVDRLASEDLVAKNGYTLQPSESQNSFSRLDINIDYGEVKHLIDSDRYDSSRESDTQDALLSDDSLVSIDEERAREVMHRMRVLTCIAAIGGFLSGYNTGVISGALLPLKRVFSLSAEQEELIVSATIFSAFVASLAGGTINTHVGRKNSVLLAAAIFTVGGFVMFSADCYGVLVLGEVLLGIGIGMESLTSPMYIAEVAKPDIRGMLVSAYALMMCFGQFFAGIIDGIFGAYEGGWRIMFVMASLPGMIMFFGFLTLPESPSWLMSAGKEDEAKEVLKTMRDSDEAVEDELLKIRQSIKSTQCNREDDSVLECFMQMMKSESTRNALVVGCGLMVLQQICGVNGVLYYAASVYKMSGFSELTSIWLSAFTSFAQILGLGVSVMFVESAGRRVLVISSFVLVAICSLGLGLAFYFARIGSDPILPGHVDEECASQSALVWDGITRNSFDCVSIEDCGFCGGFCIVGSELGPIDTCPDGSEWQYDASHNPYGWMSVLFMVAYLIVFGIGAAGLPWTINSEIYPIRYRSLAVSISTSINWLSNLLVSSTFLTISSPAVFTIYGSFFMYGIVCFIGAAWLYLALPETKGLSLDKIEQAFRRHGKGDASTAFTEFSLTTSKVKPGYERISNDKIVVNV